MTSKDLYHIKQHCEEHDVSITFTNDLIYIRKTFSFNGELMVFKRAYTYKDVHLNFLLRGTLDLFESDFEKAYEKFMEETNKMRALGEVYGEDVAGHINETWSRPSIMVTKEEPCKDFPINKFQEAHNEAIRYFTEEKGLTSVTSYEWNKKINELCGYDILDEGDSIHGVDLSLFKKESDDE